MAFCMRETDERDLNAESRKLNSCSKPKDCLSMMCELESEFRIIRMPWHTPIRMKNRQTCHLARQTRQDNIFSEGEI